MPSLFNPSCHPGGRTSPSSIAAGLFPSLPIEGFVDKSSSYRWPGAQIPETIFNKSASNCGHGLHPETTFWKVYCCISTARIEWPGAWILETIVNKSAPNCDQGLHPETTFWKDLLLFKSSLYRVGQGLEPPRLLLLNPHPIMARVCTLRLPKKKICCRISPACI